MSNFKARLDNMSLEKQMYLLRTLANHLANAEQINQLYQMLTDFDFIEAKIRKISSQAILADYELLYRSKAKISLEDTKTMKILQDVLRKISHIVDKNTMMLPEQLIGHLLTYEIPVIQTLLEKAEKGNTEPWLRPTIPSLIISEGAIERTLTGHQSDIRSIAITNDGQYAISTDKEMLVVWNIVEGKMLYTLASDKDNMFSEGISSVALTPDSQRALIIDGSKIKVLNLENGTELLTVSTGIYPYRVSVISDGQIFFAGSISTCKFWNLKSGDEMFSLDGSLSDIMAAFVSSTGYHAISTLEDDLIVWDIVSKQKLWTLSGHVDPITCVVVTPDGRLAVSASLDCTVRVWDLMHGTALHVLEGHTRSIFAVAITPDGCRAISASTDGTLKVWDMEKGVELQTLLGHGSSVTSVAITSNGRRAISGASDGIIKVWKLQEIDGFPPSTSNHGRHNGPISSVAITSNGEFAISTSIDERLAVWLLHKKKAVEVMRYQFPRDGVPIELNFFRIYDHYFEVPSSIPNYGITSVAVTPDMRYIISASGDKTVKVLKLTKKLDLIDIATRSIKIHKYALLGHSEVVRAVAVTPNSRYALTGSNDKTLKIWDLKQGVEVYTFDHDNPVTAVTVSRDGQYAISATRTTVNIWNLKTKALKSAFTYKDKEVLNVLTTTKGVRVISQDTDFNLELWDLANEEKLCQLSHPQWINGVSLTSDEQYLVSASEDGQLRMWDLARESIIASFVTDCPLLSCAVGSDGSDIVAGDRLGRVHLLRLMGKDNKKPF